MDKNGAVLTALAPGARFRQFGHDTGCRAGILSKLTVRRGPSPEGMPLKPFEELAQAADVHWYCGVRVGCCQFVSGL